MNECGIRVEFPEKNGQSLLAARRFVSIARCEAGAYFTVDVYPERSPRRPRRHFGAWQFPIPREKRVEVAVTPGGVALSADGLQIKPSNTINGGLREDGLYKIHLVVHDKEFRTLVETSFFQIIARKPEALDPAAHWPGSGRRNPARTEPAYLSLKSIAEMLRSFVAASNITAETSVLDVGCAHKPYYPFFARTGCRYIGAEIFDGQFVDAVWQAGSPLPFKDGEFDVAISTQVLEHAADPKHVIAETRRVLKPGGRIFFSAPFAWETHDYPADYWRFSEQALRLLFAEFSSVEIRPTGNSAQGLAELMNLRDHRNRGFLRNLKIRLRNRIGEMRIGARDDFAMPSNYVVTATR